MEKKPVNQKALARKQQVALEESARPYRNHYAGMRIGACSTPQSAMVAAFKHLIYGEASNAQVVAPDNHDVARLSWTTMGITVWSPPQAFARPTIAKKALADKTLRRVK